MRCTYLFQDSQYVRDTHSETVIWIVNLFMDCRCAACSNKSDRREWWEKEGRDRIKNGMNVKDLTLRCRKRRQERWKRREKKKVGSNGRYVKLWLLFCSIQFLKINEWMDSFFMKKYWWLSRCEYSVIQSLT